MSQHLSDNIRECRLRANEFDQKARNERDPVLRREYMESERRWRMLVRGYELAVRLDELGNFASAICSSEHAA